MANLSKVAEENLVNREPQATGNSVAGRIAVIDIGFNSLKLVCYEVDRKGDYGAYRVEDFKTRLGEDFDKHGAIAKAAMDRTLNSLSLFKDILSVEGIGTVLPMMTSAVRQASNRQTFLENALATTGFKINSLTGESEALLSYLGAMQSTGVKHGIFFDIGGGTLEIVYARDQKVRKIMSLPVGALRMTYEFARPDGSISGRSYDRLEKYLTKVLPTRKSLGFDDDAELVGVGGTFRAMVRFHQQVSNYPLKKIHMYRMNYRSVDIITSEIRGRAVKELRKTGVFNKARAQTITAGACVVEMLIRRLGFKTVLASSQGLREGAVVMYTKDRSDLLAGRVERQAIERIAGSVILEREQEFTRPVRLLSSLGYLDDREQTTLSRRDELWKGVSPSANIDTWFMQLLHSDTSLSHTDQLLMSLAILKSRNERISGRLERTYEMLLPKRHERTVERLSAFNDLLDFLRSTGTDISGNPLRDGITLDVSSMKAPPENLMALISDHLWEAAKIPVKYLLPNHKVPTGSMHMAKVAV